MAMCQFLMLRRSQKRTRNGLMALSSNKRARLLFKENRSFFDLLPIEVNAIIVRLTISCDESFVGVIPPDQQAQSAIALLQAGGSLGDSAALEFGSWTECDRRPGRTGLWLRTKGKNYVTTRKIAELMQERVHSLSFTRSITKKYAAILRILAPGLRRAHFFVVALPSYSLQGFKAMIQECGELDFLYIEGRYEEHKYFQEVSNFVAKIKTLQLKVHMLSRSIDATNVRQCFGALLKAVTSVASKVESVEIKLTDYRQVLDIKLLITRNGTMPASIRFIGSRQEK